MFIHFWERERDRERGTERERTGEGQRERETQNLKQVPGSELSAQRPMWGSNSQTEIMTWAKSDAPPTEPPRCPLFFTFQEQISLSPSLAFPAFPLLMPHLLLLHSTFHVITSILILPSDLLRTFSWTNKPVTKLMRFLKIIMDAFSGDAKQE